MPRKFAAAFVLLPLLLLSNIAAAETSTTVIQLWPGKAPGSEDWTQKEVETQLGELKVLRNVVNPTLTVYSPAPDKANGSAIIICPGGGFLLLAGGTDIADWLSERGVTAIILKYRIAETPASDSGFKLQGLIYWLDAWWESVIAKPGEKPKSNREDAILPLARADALQAIKVVRDHAMQWHIDPQRVGLIGFSSGGALANDVAINYGAASRPNFVAVLYSGGAFINNGIPKDAPPLFLGVAKDDNYVSPQISVAMHTAWTNAGRASELHLYENGGHGFGVAKKQKDSDRWIDDYEHWLHSLDILVTR